jgi:hypothetical protein
VLGALAAAAAATAGPPVPDPGKPQPSRAGAESAPAAVEAGARSGVPRLIFPVVGRVEYSDDFGDARSQGAHEGIDVVAAKRSLAVAAEAGTVEFHTTSVQGGCMLYLQGASGAEYLYVHLNNDLTRGNDNRGRCVPGVAYAKGLRNGAAVAAGEPVGFVGDSGDADGIHAHLHFEVHPKGGGAVNPYRHLRRARPLLFAARPGTTVDLTLSGSVVEAFDGVLSLRVETLEARPLGLELAGVGRTLELTVPPEAVVFDPVGALVAAAKLAQVGAGQEATVETEPAEATLRAQLGAPLELVASLVRLS